MKEKYKSASEWFQQLQKDPEFQKRTKELEEERKIERAKILKEREPIRIEMEQAGFKIEDPATSKSGRYFVIDSTEKTKAIPILLKHASLGYSFSIKDDLYQTMNTPLARDIAGQGLIARYIEEAPEHRSIIAYVLQTVATENDLEGLLELIENADFGEQREHLIKPIAKFMGRQATPIFLNILETEKNLKEKNNLSLSIVTELANMNAIEGKEYAEYYTKHKEAHLRNQAKKALRKINNINQTTPKLPQNIELIKDNVMTGKYEASSSLDLDVAVKFVRSLSPILNIKPKDLENLVLDIDVQQTKSYKISLKSLLSSTILCMQAFMEDNSTTTIYFFSNSKSMINKINKKLSKFLDSRENGLNR